MVKRPRDFTDASEQLARRLAIREADASCDLEGLPPTSDFAKEYDERYVTGRISADEIVQELCSFHNAEEQP